MKWPHRKAYFFEFYTWQIKYLLTFDYFSPSFTTLDRRGQWCSSPLDSQFVALFVQYRSLVHVRLFIPKPQLCASNIPLFRYKLLVGWLESCNCSEWLHFSLLHVCLRCLHANLLPASDCKLKTCKFCPFSATLLFILLVSLLNMVLAHSMANVASSIYCRPTCWSSVAVFSVVKRSFVLQYSDMMLCNNNVMRNLGHIAHP